MSDPTVSIVIVTYNSERDIARCLDSLSKQTYPTFETIVIDNDSKDRTVEIVRGSSPSRLIVNGANRGFAAAHNQGARLTEAPFYLALNPDVELTPGFVEELMEAMKTDDRIGSVTGKLLRFDDGEGGVDLIDSTGIYMTPALRHLDRGSGEPDRGQYERLQYVFGASGAAALYRRRMMDDVAVDDDLFDEDFFAYREDADLAWRAQLLGWRALYAPKAVARHARRVVPERRRSLPAEINMHGVKNRFLLRLKNQTPLEFFVLLLPSFFRDLQVLVYVLLVEWSSLPALWFVVRNFPTVWKKRRKIMARRQSSSREMLRWFGFRPVAFDVEVWTDLAPAGSR